MSMISSRFTRLFIPGLRGALFEGYGRYAPVYQKVFNVLTSQRQYEEDFTMQGLTNFVSKTEGNVISYEDFLPGNRKTYTHTTYAKGARITEEAVEDDLYGPMRKVGRALGISARATVETRAALLFNSAFVTTDYTVGDGLALYSASHTREDGGAVLSNTSTAAALSVAALETALIDLRTELDGVGKRIELMPRALVIPPDLEYVAYQVLKSAYLPGGNLNDVNPLEGRLEVIVWPYLTSTTAWFVVCDMHDFKWFWRRQLHTRTEEVFNTCDMMFKGRMRFSFGVNEWRGSHGNAGA